MAGRFTAEEEEHWRRIAQPMPGRRAEVVVADRYGAGDADGLWRSVLPGGMDDKWIVLADPDRRWVDFHRSWSGYHIYRVSFRDDGAGGLVPVDGVANRDPQQYAETDTAYDGRVLRWLIRTLLLGQAVPFPARTGLPETDALPAAWASSGAVAHRPSPDRGSRPDEDAPPHPTGTPESGRPA